MKILNLVWVSFLIFDRPDEFVFSEFWAHSAQESTVYGAPESDSLAEVSNTSFISLPAYQSIFAGHETRCTSNSCGPIEETTFAERLVNDLSLSREKVAAISSWWAISHAVEKREGTIFSNTGLAPLEDGNAEDPELALINRRQQEGSKAWGTTVATRS